MHLSWGRKNSEFCIKNEMNTRNKQELLKLREDYEQSGMSASAFAKNKGMEYWKVQYALRKALRYKDNKPPKEISFKKLIPKHPTPSNKEIRIKTSYGAEIIIPI